jgi:pentatricopeptide repeat protein
MEQGSDLNEVDCYQLTRRFLELKDTTSAIKVVKFMKSKNLEPNALTCTRLCQLCADPSTSELATTIHDVVSISKAGKDSKVLSELLMMFTKCHMSKEAKSLHQDMQKSERKPFSTRAQNQLMNLLGSINDVSAALEIFHSMEKANQLDKFSIIIIIKTLVRAKSSQQLIDHHIPLSIQLRNQLIDMYGSCDDLSKALEIFHSLKQSNKVDVASWNIMIKLLAQNNQPNQVMH